MISKTGIILYHIDKPLYHKENTGMIQRKSSKVRLVDIAARVGISKAAVSCVLNDASKNIIRVSAEKRNEIFRVARELNYVPNLTARSLAGKSSMTIGVLIDSHAPRTVFQTLWSIEEAAAASGYRLMTGQAHDNPESLFDSYNDFMRYGIDGVVCMSYEYPGHEEKVREFFRDKKNLVFYDQPSWEASCVVIERNSGMAEAVRHLQSTGRKRIALWIAGNPQVFSYSQRIEGYRQNIVGEELVHCVENVTEYAELVLKNKIDAVLASNDTTAAQLMRELLCRGLRIPEDVAVIGHDNNDFSQFTYPSLTTIDQKEVAAGRKIVELLLKQITTNSAPEKVKIPTSLIIRESSTQTTR